MLLSGYGLKVAKESTMMTNRRELGKGGTLE